MVVEGLEPAWHVVGASSYEFMPLFHRFLALSAVAAHGMAAQRCDTCPDGVTRSTVPPAGEMPYEWQGTAYGWSGGVGWAMLRAAPDVVARLDHSYALLDTLAADTHVVVKIGGKTVYSTGLVDTESVPVELEAPPPYHGVFVQAQARALRSPRLSLLRLVSFVGACLPLFVVPWVLYVRYKKRDDVDLGGQTDEQSVLGDG